jgi:NADH-quinone oxidoreductase subunit N
MSLVIAFLSLVGIPPLVGFQRQARAVHGGDQKENYEWLTIVGATNTVVSIFYYARVMAPAYFEDLTAPVPILGSWAASATVCKTVTVLAAGIAAEPVLQSLPATSLPPR